MAVFLAGISALVLGNFANPRFWIGVIADFIGLLVLMRRLPRKPLTPGHAAAMLGAIAASVFLRACETIVVPHILLGLVAVRVLYAVKRASNRLYLALLYAVICRIGRTLLIGVLFLEAGHPAVFCVGVAVRLALFALYSLYTAQVATAPKTLPDWMLIMASLAQVLFVQVMGDESFGSNYRYHLTESFICLGALCTIWAAMWRIDVEQKRRDLREIEHTIVARYKLFEQRQQISESIARMHHDLKHQLTGLAALQGTAAFHEAVDELQQSISGFETVFETGSDVLDAILSEKALQAAQDGVGLRVVADFSAVGFIRPVDLCATMGNALANAIEAARQVPDPHKRTVSVKSAAVGGYQIVKVHNYFNGELRRDGDELISSKDGPGHGVGLTSIRYSLERYQGRCDIKVRDDQFELALFFKLP